MITNTKQFHMLSSFLHKCTTKLLPKVNINQAPSAITHTLHSTCMMHHIALMILLLTSPLTAMILFGQNQLNPSEAQKYNVIGMEYLGKKDYVQAYQSFEKAINFNPSIKYYYNNLAVACMNLEKYEEALVHLTKAIEIDPLYARALSNKAICHFHLSQYRLAFAYYRKAQKADSAYTDNRFTQPKIIREMEQIRKSRPDDAQLQQIIDRVRTLKKMP